VSGTATATPGSDHGATIDLVTSKAKGPHFTPVSTTTMFKAGTSTVYAFAKIHGKHKGDAVVFTWHYPDGSKFAYDNTIVAPYDGSVTGYAELVPRGPGEYSVTTSINGHDLGTVAFTVGAGSTAATDTPTGG
jgi:hypothetical protein